MRIAPIVPSFAGQLLNVEIPLKLLTEGRHVPPNFGYAFLAEADPSFGGIFLPFDGRGWQVRPFIVSLARASRPAFSEVRLLFCNPPPAARVPRQTLVLAVFLALLALRIPLLLVGWSPV